MRGAYPSDAIPRSRLVEVASQVSHQLAVGRMIRGLDASDLGFQRPIVLVEVPEEVQLGLGRSHQKDLTVTLEGAGHLPKVPVLVVGVVPDAQIDLVGVAMDVRPGRSDARLADLLGVHLDDPSLLVIDPDDCMLHDELSLIEGGTT